MPTTLRDVRPEDKAFLLNVYASSRETEMALVPWSNEQKQNFLASQFAAQDTDYRERRPDADYKIVLLDDQPIGRIYVQREDDAIQIMDLTLLPEHRGAGIGTALLKRLLDEGAKLRKPVRIYVESFNPSLRLFGRLGFAPLGGDSINLLLEWRPAVGDGCQKEP